jgi:hypothetical protein
MTAATAARLLVAAQIVRLTRLRARQRPASTTVLARLSPTENERFGPQRFSWALYGRNVDCATQAERLKALVEGRASTDAFERPRLPRSNSSGTEGFDVFGG